VGDRVAGYLPNVPETVIAMLATTALGAIWSSGSPDFGATGILDRFGQIEPKVLVTVDGYRYGGKPLDIRPKVKEVAQALPSLRRTVVVPFLEAEPDLGGIPNAVPWSAFGPADAGALEFVRGPFERPIYVLYSSGTTGVPKAIVHGAGGTLLQHIKEHALHTDVGPDDRVFYFTTCGWMMWNWLVSGLALGATIVLYDGNPFHPDGRVLWDMAAREGVTVFGTSAKYIDALAKSDLEPGKSHDLSRLRSILSTGSPLAPESFDYVYSSIKEDVQLASISGGTDIVSCFALGNPIRPVYRGELQTRGLGLAVEVWNEHGKPVVAQKGELVCTKPFPCMPVAFWNDTDGKKYRGAYFERFPGVWHHGDFAELTPRGGVVIYGRSDAVLNPGGVRIGTAEIYRQVEQVPEVLEALCIGQDWQGDVRVVLFVRLREGETLTPEMEAHIKRRIRDSATPRHVPVRIVQVADLPRTRSGKIAELAVRDVVHGRAVANTSALANPEALDLFRDVAALQG
jgi:acetoacetyl-CoA synthetase